MPWSGEKKVFFHLVTTFTTPRSRKKKSFFWFSHYVQFLFFFLFHLVTTFTTPWLREKKDFFSFSHYVHYAMIKREIFFYFSTTFTTPWSQEKEIYIYFTTTLTTLRSWKNILFSFHYDVHYANIFLHLPASLTCRKSYQAISSPEKYV